ncbi:hypothetical protein PLICRDRAFT_247085 [Plicaturopsis crispa FD-325 SS-3]|nr:hypothetical protein PLICRDRAFT_247085 [Plicaturopsis crispa FD-325 SS-3]
MPTLSITAFIFYQADRMLASLGQWQDVGFNVNANEDLHLEDYDDDLPPLESIEGSPEIEITWGTIPSDHPLPHTREEPPEAQFPGLLLPSTPPLRPLDIGRPHPPQEFDEDEMRELPPTGSSPSRFSTVVGDRGRMIIHIDSDNEDEDDEGSDSGESTEVEDGGDDRSEGTCGRASPEDERASEQALHDAVITQETQSILAETEDLGRRAAAVVDDAVNHIEHDADPPFVTDGRGRVVWTRQGRGTTNDTANTRPAAPPQRRAGPSERHLKTRRSGRDALSPSVEPPVGGHASPASAQQSTSGGFITDGRGRVISTDTGSTHTAAVANPGPDEEPRADESDDSEGSQRSFLGRVYDAVFS